MHPEVKSLFELHRLYAPFCQGEAGRKHSVVTVHRFWFCAKLPDPPRYWEENGVI